MLGPQIPEESLRHEAFDYGDSEDEVSQPTIATVNPTPPSLPHFTDLKVTILQGDPSVLNSLQPDASVNFVQDDKPLLASPTFSNLGDETSLLGEDKALSELVNAGGQQNDLAIAAITFPPNTHTHATTPTRDSYTRGHNLQPTQDEPITPTKTFYAGGASIHRLELAPGNLLDSSTDELETSIPLLQDYSDLADPDLPAHCHSTPDTRSSSPALSYDDEEDLDASTDKTLEDPLGEVISDNPTSLEDQRDVESEGVPQPEYLQDTDERSDVDMNIPPSIHGSTITLSMTILPIIPMTPANSPILEGLSQYMTSHDSDTPGVISQETSGVGSDKSTSESTSLEPSDKSNLTPEPDIDIPIQPGPPLSQIQIRDSHLGMSNGGLSSYQRMQMGLLHVVPTFFALSRETINGQHHGASLRL